MWDFTFPWNRSSHPLDEVPPSKVLDRTFQAFGCCCRRVGMLPFIIQEDGYTHFKFCSRPMWHLGLYFALFISLSVIYIPFYMEYTANKNLQMVTINYISENVFVGSQYLGTLSTIVLVPSMAKGVSRFWNKLVPLIEILISQGHRNLFRNPYLRSRVSLLAFMIYMHSYAIICWMYLSPSIEELGKWGHLKYWIHAIGYIIFFGSFTFHLVHSLIFMFFVFTLRICFLGLKESALSLITIAGCKETKEELSVSQLISIYNKLSEVCKHIGDTYGLHLLIQLVIMMTSSLMNVFAMLSQFKQRDPVTTILSFLGYSAWLVFVTESGERLRKATTTCSDAIREAAFTLNVDQVTLHQVSSLQIPKLTAANFFTINRRALITATSTFATYCVVMIQFKLNGQA